MLGPNGAGKTTTLQMLLGVMKPTSGEINYFGKNLWQNRSEILEQVNFSSTYVDLPWDLKIREVLNYVSYLYKISDRKSRINEVIKLFKLTELMKCKVNDLSAGQLTRLNLAKAFINKPKVLLLDEPTASLDPDIADYIRKFLLKTKADHSMSVIITSHNMAEVTELCDRVIFINKGKIVANDTPANLAKTTKTAEIELYFPDNDKDVFNFLSSKGFNCTNQEGRVTFEIEELRIAETLQELTSHGYIYHEINIKKPTLEDYFLQLAKSYDKTS